MNVDAEAILERALKFVLEQQATLLKRQDFGQLGKLILALNELGVEIQKVIAMSFKREKAVQSLKAKATELEKLCDDLSEDLWTHIPVTVCSVFERLEEVLQPRDQERQARAEIRSHYQTIRMRLLQQTLGARILDSNSDLGDEVERIWQQFLQRTLGPSVRVLRGGVICDDNGKCSEHQIDLIIVPAEAQIMIPGDSEGGKVHVPIDYVISAIMVTANLTGKKLRSDWEALAKIPAYAALEEDHPLLARKAPLKSHPWPLRYIIGAQSDPIEVLTEAWHRAAIDKIGPAPEFAFTLDSGCLYSGATSWPRPRSPHTEAEEVLTLQGVHHGLGIGWMIAQHQGRLAVIQRRALGPIVRYAKQLNSSGYSQPPATYSSKFNAFFRHQEIVGIFKWGRCSMWPHNRLPLVTIELRDGEMLRLKGATSESRSFSNWLNDARWFKYGEFAEAGDLIAFEEWLNSESKQDHQRRIAVFHKNTGDEVNGPQVEALKSVSDIGTLQL